jgi:hypothetical protein
MFCLPGDIIAVGDCEGTVCDGYQYIRLMDNQNNELTYAYETCGTDLYCAYLTYAVTGTDHYHLISIFIVAVRLASECQTYSLLEGCLGDDECSGSMSLTATGNDFSVRYNMMA